MTTLTLARRALTAFWLVLLVGLVALAAGSRVAPLVGHDVYIITGGSMSPAIPRGAIVIDERLPGTDVRVGDIVTVRAHDAVMVTHRVLAISDDTAGRQLQLKGDHNAAPDAALMPAAHTAGRVVAFVPVAGYILAMLSQPSGLISVLSMLTSLYLAIRLLELLEEDQRRTSRLRGPAVGVTSTA